MKKNFIIALIGIITIFSANIAHAKKEVIIFSQPCHYCDLMKKDLDAKIIPANPDVKFTVLDLRDKGVHKKLGKYIKKHKIDGESVGTPLLFVGDNYIMGWGDDANKKMTKYIQELKD